MVTWFHQIGMVSVRLRGQIGDLSIKYIGAAEGSVSCIEVSFHSFSRFMEQTQVMLKHHNCIYKYSRAHFS